MNNGLGAGAKHLDQLVKELSGRTAVRRLERAGRDLKREVDDAVKADLGDSSMSGWRRSKPIDIKGTAKVKGMVLEIGPNAAGPMRVLESGRQAHSAGDSRSAGFRVRKKDGVRVQKNRKVKRNVGATKGKGTWSDADERIVRKAPGLIHDQVITGALNAVYRRG